HGAILGGHDLMEYAVGTDGLSGCHDLVDSRLAEPKEIIPPDVQGCRSAALLEQGLRDAPSGQLDPRFVGKDVSVCETRRIRHADASARSVEANGRRRITRESSGLTQR